MWQETGEAGITEFIRRLAFNAMVGNGDAHLKNWSLIYPDGRTAALAPAYDLVGTVAYIPNETLGLSIAGTTIFSEINPDRFRRFAARAGLPTRLVVKTAVETAQAVRDLWPSHEPLRLLPQSVHRAISAHLETVPL